MRQLRGALVLRLVVEVLGLESGTNLLEAFALFGQPVACVVGLHQNASVAT